MPNSISQKKKHHTGLIKNEVRLFCLTILILSSVGCSQPLYWAKPGAQPGEYEQDVTDCRRTLATEGSKGILSPTQLNPAIGISQSAVEECLGAKGWFLAEKPDNEGS